MRNLTVQDSEMWAAAYRWSWLLSNAPQLMVMDTSTGHWRCTDIKFQYTAMIWTDVFIVSSFAENPDWDGCLIKAVRASHRPLIRATLRQLLEGQ